MADQMSSSEDLRGSTPVLTAKDVLLELREDVRSMRTSVDVLVSQDLSNRVTAIERWQNRLIGLGMVGTLLALAAIALQLVDRVGA